MKRLVLTVLIVAAACRREAPTAAPTPAPTPVVTPVAVPAPPPEPLPVVTPDAAVAVVDAAAPVD
jgi:hypothetical protein